MTKKPIDVASLAWLPDEQRESAAADMQAEAIVAVFSGLIAGEFRAWAASESAGYHEGKPELEHTDEALSQGWHVRSSDGMGRLSFDLELLVTAKFLPTVKIQDDRTVFQYDQTVRSFVLSGDDPLVHARRIEVEDRTASWLRGQLGKLAVPGWDLQLKESADPYVVLRDLTRGLHLDFFCVCSIPSRG